MCSIQAENDHKVRVQHDRPTGSRNRNILRTLTSPSRTKLGAENRISAPVYGSIETTCVRKGQPTTFCSACSRSKKGINTYLTDESRWHLGSRVGLVLLAVGIGLLGGGIIAYLTGAMTIADVSRDCRVLGGPCPAGEGETLRTGQNEELGGAASIVAGLELTVLGFGIGVRTKRP